VQTTKSIFVSLTAQAADGRATGNNVARPYKDQRISCLSVCKEGRQLKPDEEVDVPLLSIINKSETAHIRQETAGWLP